jgi:hypothetical protein
MKMKVVEVVPAPPPKRVILDLSEGEADFIRDIMIYYASALGAGEGVVPARKLSALLFQFQGKRQYPYTGYFEESV